MKTNKPRIFISYAREDKPKALKLYEEILNNGCIPWIDEFDLVIGQEWRNEIRNAISRTDFFIACFSNLSVNKIGFFQTELKEAYEIFQEFPANRVFFLPVRIEPCEIPVDIRKLHWLDFFQDGYQSKLIESIKVEWIKRGNDWPEENAALENEIAFAGTTKFRGVSVIQLDSKRRLKIPNRYRQKFNKEELVTIVPDPTESCALLYQNSEYEKIISQFKTEMKPTDFQNFGRVFMGNSVDMDVDDEGRIYIPGHISERTRIKPGSFVLLVGQGHKFEIWEEQMWNERMAIWKDEIELDADNASDELKNTIF
jgi:division/cell wall cluster transcriptional repressor MraZ